MAVGRNRAGRPFRGAGHGGARLCHFGQDALGMLAQSLAGFRQGEATMMPNEQPRAEFFFQQRQLPRQSGLGRVYGRGGGFQTTRLRHDQKVLQRPEIHRQGIADCYRIDQ
jgi:hypothetical protein